MNANRFEGKVALITGGCSGLGLAAAQYLAAEGCSVALCDKNAGLFEYAGQEIEKTGGKCETIETDVTEEGSLVDAFNRTIEVFGAIDIVITSAGVGDGTRIESLTQGTWNRIVDVNLKGTYLTCRLAIEHMRKNPNGGAIVTISSIGGMTAVYGGSAFAASKAGVIHMTRSLGVEVARENIRINCICPGVIMTNLTEKWLNQPGKRRTISFAHPAGRIGEPIEVAAAIAFLASDEASFITGVALPVDGGYTAGKRSDMDRRFTDE
jgi:NAD(P)-dependent dehydrogenase (short-subunit alcohol dehydrogenase family)